MLLLQLLLMLPLLRLLLKKSLDRRWPLAWLNQDACSLTAIAAIKHVGQIGRGRVGGGKFTFLFAEPGIFEENKASHQLHPHLPATTIPICGLGAPHCTVKVNENRIDSRLTTTAINLFIG
jgi:hypothetical protein